MKVWIGLLIVLMVPMYQPVSAKDELVVYSSRKEHLIKPLFDRYQEKHGIKIKYITDNPGPLIARLKAEGGKTPADLLLTVDAGNLWHATKTGVLQPVKSAVLEKNIPEHLRDQQGHWFGLSVRARTIAYNPKRVQAADLSSYQNLADKKWQGRLCLRTSKKVYNQSLVAMMINHHGVDSTESIVKGWVDNLAFSPFSNDTKALQAVAAGRCDVTIVNTYYYGRLLKKDADLPVKLFWPNQNSEGVHVNISGAGLVKKPGAAKAATALLEWLSGQEAQQMFVSLNMEYPANGGIKPDAMVAAWGAFKEDKTNMAKAGELQSAAVKLMDRAGYR